MYRHICVSANELIAESSPENSELAGMLTDFAQVCGLEGRRAVTVSTQNGARSFMAGSFCGFARLTDGTLLEILPPTGKGSDYSRKVLCAEFCRRSGFTFSESSFPPDTNFMEYIISVFAGETMKIIKSGVLSAYASREENMNAVHGTIMFSENIRRNLVHRERIYVRHDVFTPDRAENRIIKAGAALLLKLTDSSRSKHLLSEALSYLDEVSVTYNVPLEFSRCVNTRNARKYSIVLNICRMLFDKKEGTAFSGKYISCAQFYEMHPQAPVRRRKVKVVKRKR